MSNFWQALKLKIKFQKFLQETPSCTLTKKMIISVLSVKTCAFWNLCCLVFVSFLISRHGALISEMKTVRALVIWNDVFHFSNFDEEFLKISLVVSLFPSQFEIEGFLPCLLHLLCTSTRLEFSINFSENCDKKPQDKTRVIRRDAVWQYSLSNIDFWLMTYFALNVWPITQLSRRWRCHKIGRDCELELQFSIKCLGPYFCLTQAASILFCLERILRTM